MTRKISAILLLSMVASQVSLAVFSWYLHVTRTDDHFLNVAGRQRMLAASLRDWVHMVGGGQEEDRPRLAQLIESFDQALRAMASGGMVLDDHVDPPAPEVGEALAPVQALWRQLKPDLIIVATRPRGAPEFKGAFDRSDAGLAALKDVSQDLVTRFEAREQRLRGDVLAALVAAACATFLVLLSGIVFARRYIIQPILLMKKAVERVANGDYSVQIEPTTKDELASLVKAFNAMSSRIGVLMGLVERRRQHVEGLLHGQEEFAARLGCILQSAVNGIVTIGDDSRIRVFNTAAERLFGYSAEEVVGRDVGLLMPGGYAGAHAAAMATYLETGETRVIGREREVEGFRKDGTVFPLAIRVSEVKGVAGREFVGILWDLTEERRTGAALRAKTEHLEAIADAMATFLRTGSWRDASSALLKAALTLTGSEYGFAGVMVEGPALRVIAHEGIRWDARINRQFYEDALRSYQEAGYLEFKRFNNLFGAVVTGGGAVLSNEPGKDPRSGGLPPGHPPLNSFLGVPLVRDAEVVGMIGVANRSGGYTSAERSILEALSQTAGVLYEGYRRQQREAGLEAQLRQAQKMDAIGQLAGGIAHDFNNLLMGIGGFAEMCRQGHAPDDPHWKYAEEVRRGVERAAALTRQLLAFSRKQVLQPRLLDLNALVSDVESMLRRLIGEDICLMTPLAPDLGMVKADSGQIQQVILNLVVNARDAMPGGGTLTIETVNVDLDGVHAMEHPGAQMGPWVLLSVSDTGCGMSPEVRARIFEPFFTTKEQGKGTGLGLATVYGIVRQSGGHIACYSEEGRGTSFKVYLPRVEGEVAAPPAPVVPVALPTGTETILVTEDEDLVRSLVVEALRNNAYAVLEARNGVEALEMCERHAGPIHLLITDMVMPGMNGLELAKRLASLRPEMRVLHMSGYAERAMMNGERLAADAAFLEKPFALGTLAKKVREVLDRGVGPSDGGPPAPPH